MIFWVNACRSFTLENIQWKNVSFCWGSVRIDSMLTSPGTDPCHTQAPTTWHWTWRKPPSEPACRLWIQNLETWFIQSYPLHCREKKRSPTSPCNRSIFISQITQAGRGWWEIFSFFKRSKCLAWCSVHPQHTGTWPRTGTQRWSDGHGALGYHIWYLTQTPALPACQTLGSNLCWGQVPKATSF